jgi:hypothetical protein
MSRDWSIVTDKLQQLLIVITVFESVVGDQLHAKFYTPYCNCEILSVFQRETFAELVQILPILHVQGIFMIRKNNTNVELPF